MKTQSRIPWLETLDTHQFGETRCGAAYVIRGETVAVVETGTALAAEEWIGRLRGEMVSHVFLTHIHLDHAGGAGILSSEHPEATIVVHSRGAAHLADPRRLIEGVRAASPSTFPLYGTPEPIPADRIHAVSDGERFDLGRGVVLQAIESPGHAPHHVCYHEPGSGCLFAGDALGNHQVRPAVPLTVPPGYDLAKGLATLDRLAALRPVWIAYTHFGVAAEGPARVEAYRHALVSWFERIGCMRTDRSEDEVVEAIKRLPEHRDLTEKQRALLEMCVRGALRSRTGES